MTPVLLLTRPREEAERFARSVAALRGAVPETVISPLMEIRPVPAEAPGGVAGLILTSERGAAAAGRLGLPRGLPAWCVGARTAAAAEAAGFVALPGGGDAAALVSRLLAERPPGPLLHLRGRHARGEIADRLAEAGLVAWERVVYEQAARPLTAAARALLAGDRPVLAPVFSPRSGALLAEAGPVAAPLWIAAISRAAAEPAAPLSPVRLEVAERPDGPAMAALVCRMLEEMPRAHPSS